MKTISKKLLSLLLTVAIVLQLLPAAVFAEETELPAAEPMETTQDVPSSATILFEEKALREEKVKHFRLDDGSYIAVRYGTPVHYEDDGEWVEYDNTLLPITAQGTVTGYRVVNGDSIRLFAADANAEVLLAVQKGNYGLSMTPVREPDAELPIVPDQPVVANGSITEDSEATLIPAEILTTAAPASQTIEDPFLAQVQPEKLYSALEYPASFHGATLRYENYGNTMKESIVISAPQTEYSYAFTLQTEGLTPTLQTDGSILLAAADGTVVYAIPAPYMVDANQEYSYDAAYTLTGSGSSYILTVTADADWINAEGRAFPVLLDPTISEFATGDTMISATFVRQGSGTGSAVSTTPDDDRSGLYAGSLDITADNPNGLTRSYFHINEGFIELPPGSELMQAKLNLYQISYGTETGGSDTLELGIYALDKANGLTLNNISASAWATWAQGLTWSLAQDPTKTVCNTTLIDKQTLSAATSCGYIAWNITTMAFDWYQDPQTNLGFVLMATDESEVSSRASFASPNTVYGMPPVLVLAYRNIVGVESYYSAQTVGIGRAGTAYISDFSMQGTIITPLISSSSNVMPFGLSLIYNTAYESCLFGADGGMHTKPFTSMRFGGGWKLSAQETVIKQALVDNPSGVSDYCLIHTDADGTEHYYYYDTDEESLSYGYYANENGLKLKIQDNDPDFVMTDESGNTWHFGNGFLKWQTDAYGNTISYNYLGTGQLGSITRQNNGAAAETLATFAYYSSNESYTNFLKSVTDEAGRVTSFDYTIYTDPEGILAPVTCLTTITFPDGETAEYNYFSNTKFYRWAKMESAYDTEANYGIEFSYSYSGDLRNIYEYVLSENERVYGTKMHGYRRSRSQSVYRYYGDDGIDQGSDPTGDDLLSSKVFDAVGRTISSYTTDITETVILGTANASYEQNSGTSATNNRLTSLAQTGQQGINLLRNGGAEKYSTNWKNGSSTTSVALTGSRSLTVNNKTSYQEITLTGGTEYTFSGYVKTGSNSSAMLALQTESATLATSERVTFATGEVNGGWLRLSVTYTPETTGTFRAAIVGTGIVYADDLQLLVGAAATSSNFLEESSFEVMGNLTKATEENFWGTAPGYWYKINTVTMATDTTFFGSGVISVPGDGNNNRALQHVVMDCEPGSSFLVSAWAKASANPNSVAKKESATSDDPYFGIIVRLRYANEAVDELYYPFDPFYDGWQFCQGVVAPKEENIAEEITDIVVLLAYDQNYNTALFDNVSLSVGPTQRFSYDENGNLTDAAQAGQGSSASEYGNGVDLTEYTSANGNKFNYTYNAQHDVLTATASGIKNTYVYDAAGNVFSSTLTSTNTTDNPAYLYSAADVSPDKNHTTLVNDASGGITSYTYNYGYQYMTSSTNANDVTTYYTYYPQNSRQKQTYQSGIAAVTYTYDGAQLSQLDRKTFRSGTEQHQYYNFAYNLWGQSTSVKVGTIPLATYAYADMNGNAAGTGGGLMSSMTYGNGDSVTYTYDTFDRLEKVVYNDTGNYIEYLYTADGALGELHYKKSNGTVINSYTFEYDSLGRLIRSAEYNASGLVQRTEHLYDEHNRLSSQSWNIQGDDFSESYTYNDPETAEDSGDGSLLQMTTAAATIDYRYDDLKRLDGTTVTPKDASTALYTSTYAYKNNADGNTTNLVAEYRVQGSNIYSSYTYTYDELGNITAIYGQLSATENPRVLAVYTYDSQNQLEQEIIYTYSSAASNTSETTRYKYNYDTAGNLLSVEKYDGLTDTTPDTTSYTYDNAQWLDLLTAYDGGKFAYEGQTFTETVSPKGTVLFSVRGTPTSGNPISYYNGTRWTMEWQQGRDLSKTISTSTNTTVVSAAKEDTEVTQTYTYNADGIRTGKTSTTKVYKYSLSSGGGVVASVGDELVDPSASYVRYLYSTVTTTHNYVTQDGKVVRETIGSGTTAKVLDFIYDETGRPFALIYTNGAADPVNYYYVLNLQGDVVGLLNSSGTLVANYSYNAWGEIISVTNANGVAITSSTHIATLNPLRYRGYYYDTETGFYYVSSRYYDPEIGRWINADGYVSTGQGVLGNNMFAYCGNNPVNRKDPTGQFWITALIVTAVVAVCTVTLSGCSAKPDPAPLPYKTADEAAMAFANSTYSSSSYIRHEYGTVIYSSTTNGTTTYDFATPVAGSPHSVGYGNVKIPSGTTKVATAHTHPNSNNFSGLTPGATSGDIPNAIRRGLDSYVIGPNLNLQKYSISSGTVSVVGVASPVALTSQQQAALVSQFQISWDNHLGTCAFGCEHMTWPTP